MRLENALISAAAVIAYLGLDALHTLGAHAFVHGPFFILVDPAVYMTTAEMDPYIIASFET